MKVALYLKRPDSDTETAIFARISYNGNQLKYYLPETILPKYWNKDTNRAKESQKFKEYPEFNARLNNIESTIKNVFRKYQNDNNNDTPSTDVLKELLNSQIKKKSKAKNSDSFLAFFEEIINQTKSGVRIIPKSGKLYSINSAKVYHTAFTHLCAYQKISKKRIDYDTIDVPFYMDFKEYLIKQKDMQINTFSRNISVIKLVMGEAFERGLHNNMAYKSKKFAIVREESESIYLSQNEIDEMENLDLSHNSRLDRVRDLFLIGCHTGLRYSDYSTLQPHHIQGKQIKITQTKTGKPVTIPLHKVVEKILAKYNGSLPDSISNQKTNEYLKEIGKLIPALQRSESKSTTKGGKRVTTTQQKWELLTSHTARRSFATNMYLMEIPTYTIMAITGHRTEQSFKKYIKLNSDEHAKVMQMHWDKAAMKAAN